MPASADFCEFVHEPSRHVGLRNASRTDPTGFGRIDEGHEMRANSRLPMAAAVSVVPSLGFESRQGTVAKALQTYGFSHSEGPVRAGQRQLCQSRLPLPSPSPRQRRLVSLKGRWGGATARSRQRRGPAPEERRGLLHRQHRHRALVEAVVAISRACSCAGGASHPGRSGLRRHATLGCDPSGQRDGSRRQPGPTETPRLGWRQGLL